MIKLIAFLSFVTINSSYDASTINRQQMYCLAKAVYHEARGEDVVGQMAVAHVVINRATDSRYPFGICAVVNQPKQFSGIDYAVIDYNSKAWERAIEAAVFASLGITDDPTGGATHYYAHKKVSPYWKNSLVKTARIGNHTFFR